MKTAKTIPWLLLVTLLLLVAAPVHADHRLVTQGNNKLAIVEKDGSISWQMQWGGIHDLHVLENGNIMVQRRMREICEINPLLDTLNTMAENSLNVFEAVLEAIQSRPVSSSIRGINESTS